MPSPHGLNLPAPRPLSRKARVRSWLEPAVRSWWLMAAAVLLLIMSLIVQRLYEARQTRFRIQQWTRVNARIESLGGARHSTYRVRPDELGYRIAVLRYTDAGGVMHELDGYFEAQSAAIGPGFIIPILVDPARGTQWTDRLVAEPLMNTLMLPLLLLTIPAACAVVAWIKRQRRLQVWRLGRAREAAIVDGRRTALSPKSTLYRCALKDGSDKTLLPIVVPDSAGKLSPGDRIWLIMPARASYSQTIAALLYE